MEYATLRVGIDSRGAVAGGRRVERSMDRMGDAAQRAERRMQGINAAGMGMGMMAKQMAASFAAMGAAMGTAGLGATFAQVNAGFQETMATVRGVTGAGAEAFAAMNARARELGATTRFSATQAADAILFLSRTGYNATQAIEAVSHTLHLAAAGALELGEAADFASNIAQQFRIPAEDMQRVVDTLITVSNRANTDVRQLAEAMKYAGGTAGFLTLSIEETAAAFGVMGDVGIQASSAGTSLRMALMKMTGPTKQGADRLQEMGIAAEDLARTLTEDGLHAALTMLRDGLERTYGDDLAMKAQALNEITRITAVEGVMAMIAGLDKMKQVTGEAAQQVGSAANMMAIMDDTLSGAFRSLRSAVEEMFLILGESTNTALQEFLEQATLVVRAIGGMEVGVNGVTAEAKQMADMIKGVATALGAMLGMQVAKWIYGITAALATNPFGLIAVGISAAIAAYQRFKDETFSLGGEFVSLSALASAAWEVISEDISSVISTVWPYVRAGLEQLGSYFQTVFNNIGRVVTFAFNEVIRPQINAMGAAWNTLVDFLTGSGRDMANLIVGSFAAMGAAMDSVFRAIQSNVGGLGTFVEFLDAAIYTMRNPMTAALDGTAERLWNLKDELGKVDFAADLNIDGAVRESLSTDWMAALESQGIRFRQIGRQSGQQVGAGLLQGLSAFSPLGAYFSSAMPRIMARAGAIQADTLAGRAVPGVQSAIDAASRAMMFGMGPSPITGTGDAFNAAEMAARQREAAAVGSIVADMQDSELEGADAIGARGNIFTRTWEQAGIAAEQAASIMDTTLYPSIERQSEAMLSLQNAAMQAMDTLSSGLADALLGAKSFGAAMGDVMQSIARMAVQMAVQQGMRALFGAGGGFGGGFANGAAFSGGNVVPFATGGVVDSPTWFPMSGGRTGLMGEAGPEAIMPLERGPGGRLGVRGGGSQTVNITVQSPDAGSFRRGERQLARRTAAAIRREQER